MKLIATSINDSHVTMRFADDDDRGKAKEWLDFQVPISALKAPPKKLGMFAQADVDWGLTKAPPPEPLKLDRQPVGVVQVAALRYLRVLIDAQIRALGGEL